MRYITDEGLLLIKHFEGFSAGRIDEEQGELLHQNLLERIDRKVDK